MAVSLIAENRAKTLSHTETCYGITTLVQQLELHITYVDPRLLDRGEVVLDPFSGSGTTLIAAEVCGRRARAVELDPIYVDTSVIRWQDFAGKEAVLAETGETFAQVRARRGVDTAGTPTDSNAMSGDQPLSEEVV